MHRRATVRRKPRQSSVRRLPRRSSAASVNVEEISGVVELPVEAPNPTDVQSGDAQGLPRTARSSEESVEALAASEQSYEAALIEGVEDAGDHPERPVRVHSSDRPLSEDELASTDRDDS